MASASIKLQASWRGRAGRGVAEAIRLEMAGQVGAIVLLQRVQRGKVARRVFGGLLAERAEIKRREWEAQQDPVEQALKGLRVAIELQPEAWIPLAGLELESMEALVGRQVEIKKHGRGSVTKWVKESGQHVVRIAATGKAVTKTLARHGCKVLDQAYVEARVHELVHGHAAKQDKAAGGGSDSDVRDRKWSAEGWAEEYSDAEEEGGGNEEDAGGAVARGRKWSAESWATAESEGPAAGSEAGFALVPAAGEEGEGLAGPDSSQWGGEVWAGGDVTPDSSLPPTPRDGLHSPRQPNAAARAVLRREAVWSAEVFADPLRAEREEARRLTRPLFYSMETTAEREGHETADPRPATTAAPGMLDSALVADAGDAAEREMMNATWQPRPQAGEAETKAQLAAKAAEQWEASGGKQRLQKAEAAIAAKQEALEAVRARRQSATEKAFATGQVAYAAVIDVEFDGEEEAAEEELAAAYERVAALKVEDPTRTAEATTGGGGELAAEPEVLDVEEADREVRMVRYRRQSAVEIMQDAGASVEDVAKTEAEYEEAEKKAAAELELAKLSVALEAEADETAGQLGAAAAARAVAAEAAAEAEKKRAALERQSRIVTGRNARFRRLSAFEVTKAAMAHADLAVAQKEEAEAQAALAKVDAELKKEEQGVTKADVKVKRFRRLSAVGMDSASIVTTLTKEEEQKPKVAPEGKKMQRFRRLSAVGMASPLDLAAAVMEQNDMQRAKAKEEQEKAAAEEKAVAEAEEARRLKEEQLVAARQAAEERRQQAMRVRVALEEEEAVRLAAEGTDEGGQVDGKPQTGQVTRGRRAAAAEAIGAELDAEIDAATDANQEASERAALAANPAGKPRFSMRALKAQVAPSEYNSSDEYDYEDEIPEDQEAEEEIFFTKAMDWHQKGEFDTALDLYEELLDAQVERLGVEHPQTLQTRYNLAILSEQMGQHKAAEAHYREVEKHRVAALGEDDPAVLRTRMGLVNVLAVQGHAEAAEKLCLTVEETQIELLGLDHPDTLKTQMNLAGLWARGGQLVEAERMIRVVLSSQVRKLGKTHPDVLTTQINLAHLIADQGNPKQAERMAKKIEQAQAAVLGPSHPDVARTRATRTLLAKELAVAPEKPEGFKLRGGKLTPQQSLGNRKRPPDPRMHKFRGMEAIIEHETTRPDTPPPESVVAAVAASDGMEADRGDGAAAGTAAPEEQPRLPRAIARKEFSLDCDDGTLLTCKVGHILVLVEALPGRFWRAYPEDEGPDYTGRFLRAPLSTNKTVVELLAEGSGTWSPRHLKERRYAGLGGPELLRQIEAFNQAGLANQLEAARAHRAALWSAEIWNDGLSEAASSEAGGGGPSSAEGGAGDGWRSEGWLRSDTPAGSRHSETEEEVPDFDMWVDEAWVSRAVQEQESEPGPPARPMSRARANVAHAKLKVRALLTSAFALSAAGSLAAAAAAAAEAEAWEAEAEAEHAEAEAEEAEEAKAVRVEAEAVRVETLRREVQLVTPCSQISEPAERSPSIADSRVPSSVSDMWGGEAWASRDVPEPEPEPEPDPEELSTAAANITHANAKVCALLAAASTFSTAGDVAAAAAAAAEAAAAEAAAPEAEEAAAEAEAARVVAEEAARMAAAKAEAETEASMVFVGQWAAAASVVVNVAEAEADTAVDAALETAMRIELAPEIATECVRNAIAESLYKLWTDQLSEMMNSTAGGGTLAAGVERDGSATVAFDMVDKRPEAVLNRNMARAMAGDPWAQMRLGLRHLDGDGVEFSRKEALVWLRAAAKQGYSPAVKKVEEMDWLAGLSQPAAAAASASLKKTIGAWQATTVSKAANRFKMMRRRGAVTADTADQDAEKGFQQEFDRAMAAAVRGHYAEATLPLARAARLRPKDKDVAYNLAACHALATRTLQLPHSPGRSSPGRQRNATRSPVPRSLGRRAAAGEGHEKEAEKWLMKAIELGLTERELAEDPDYKVVFAANRFRAIFRQLKEDALNASGELYMNRRGRRRAVRHPS